MNAMTWKFRMGRSGAGTPIARDCAVRSFRGDAKAVGSLAPEMSRP